MNSHLAVLLTAALVTGAGHAQAQSSTDAKVTAVGCVARALTDGSLTGSPGVAPASPNEAPTLANSSEPTGVLFLNHATIPGSPEGTAGTSTAYRARSFQLDGPAADIEPHIGHRVEVTGTVRRVDSATAAAQKTRIDHILVTSIRMLAPTCDSERP